MTYIEVDLGVTRLRWERGMKNRVNERLRMIIGSLVSLACRRNILVRHLCETGVCGTITGLGGIMGILVIAVREYKWSRKYGRVGVHGAMWVKSMSCTTFDQ